MRDAQSHFLSPCPHCSAGLRIRREYLGQQVCCKYCDQVFVALDAAEKERLQPSYDEVRAEHESLHEAHGKLEEAHARLQASYAERLLADRTLASEIEELKAARDQIAAARDRLQAERNEAAKDRDDLAAERDDLRSRNDRLQKEREHLEADLISIRRDLGETAPGDVRAIAEERTSLQLLAERLRGEGERLGGEVELLRGKLASLSEHCAALEESARTQQQSEADSVAARGELDRLSALVRDRDAELAKAFAERDSVRTEREGALAEAEQLRTTASRREREQRERVQRDSAQIDRLQADVQRLSSEYDRLVALVRDRDAELATAFAERDSIRAEREGSVAEAERLRNTLARLEQEQRDRARHDGAENGRRQAEVLRLSSESSRLAALVRDRDAELAEAFAERDSIRAEQELSVAEANRLRDTVARLERERQERVQHDGALIERLQVDFDQALTESSRLAALVRDRDAELATASAERDSIRAEQEVSVAEAERLRATLAQLEREQQERGQHDGIEIDRLRLDVHRLSSETDRLAALVRDRDTELATAFAERDSIRAEQEGSAAEAARLRATLAQLEREQQERVPHEGIEIDRLQVEVHRLSSEADRLAALVRDREAELETAVAERERLSVERGSTKVQLERLRMALDQLERDSVERDERYGADLDRLRAMNERLRAEAHGFAAAVSFPARDDALREAYAQLASLQREVIHLRHQARQMRWLAGPQLPDRSGAPGRAGPD